jgi:hypothetical protein
MRDFRDAKAMAHSLREALKSRAVETTHSECLELIAKAFGYDNWNILSAKIEAARPCFIDSKVSAAATQEPALPKTLHCSFCGKSQHEVRKLIAGPSVYICDECVELCVDISRDGILWKVLSFLRSREEIGSDGFEPLLDHVRSKSTEEVVSYVEQSKVGTLDGRRTLQFIDRRLEMPDSEEPLHDDARAARLFAHLKTKTKEELVALRKTAQREMMHYEDALRIGTTVLDERRRGKSLVRGEEPAV